MALYFAFMKAAGRAALNAVGGGLAGDVLCDVLPDVARKVYEWWGAGKNPDERQAEIAALAQAAPAEVRAAAEQVAAEVAAGQPPEVRQRLTVYLSLIPGAVRASLRQAGQPSNALVAAPATPDDLIPLLPAHLPRFRPGGRPLAGIDWELEELLGSGGFGEVWKARNPHFDAVAPVALKFCLDPAAKDRLLRHEAAVLNQVMRQGRHPGIVQLRQTYLSADPPCLEYEYVSGGDLSGLIRRWKQAPPGAERVVRLMHDLAGIVAFAHQLSPPVVHRDLKPANILLETDGDGVALRVADFGISGVAASRAVSAATRGVSQGAFLVTALRGAHTPLYASPQQMRGDPPDPRDDTYSLGVIWYQLLTGDLVTGRPGGTRWMGRLTAAGVPAAHLDLLSACLEDDPADRPANAAVLAAGLAGLAGKASGGSQPPEAKGSTSAEALGGGKSPAGLRGPTSPARPEDIPVRETCPDCGGGMKVRVNKRGGCFLGCVRFPVCRGTLPPPPEVAEQVKAMRGEPAPPAAELPKQMVNSLGMRFALVPTGTFLMGSPAGEAMRGADEDLPRTVAVERPFYLGVFPVTQKEYEAVLRSNPAHFQRKNGGSPEHPVEQVSWDDAQEFCRRLSALAEEKKAGRVYRLPTEAEWEYACRAGTTSPFHFGNGLTSTQANFDGSRPYGGAAAGPFRQATTKVGSFAPNAWGLCDVHGNVWEWCADWYTPGIHRAVRGGSWNNSGHLCRSARRQKYAPDYRGDNVGFRVAVEASEPA